MGATLQIQAGTGASVTWANAEGGVKFSLDDAISPGSPTPIQVPTSTGTNYSWIKNFALSVTATASTSISNRKINMASSPATGITLNWKAVAVGSYAQAATGNRPASAGTNGAVPSTYTAMTTSAAVYDSSSVSAGSTGPNGSMAVVVMGVDNTFTGGGGSAALPNLQFTYDES